MELLTETLREQIRTGKHPRLKGNTSSGLTGDISGRLTGDIGGRLRGDVTGLRGDISGLTGDISGRLTGDISRLTGDIAKGKYPGLSVIVADEQEIAHLDEVREVILAKPERLTMQTWHSREWTPEHVEEPSCGTTHCLAGHLQALCPDPEIRRMDPEKAGRLLAPASAYLFFSDNDTVLSWLKNREYAEALMGGELRGDRRRASGTGKDRGSS